MRDDRALDRPEDLDRPGAPDRQRVLDRPETPDRPGASDRPEAPGQPSAPDRPSAADRRREGGVRSPADLGRRLNALPDGHPSSPYEASGAPRPPSVRLRDLDTGLDEDADRRDDDVSHSASADRLDDRSRGPAADPDDARGPDEIRRYTDAEWADHVADVRTCLDKAQADGQATDRQYTIDPDRSRWKRDRRQLQGEIVDMLYEQAADVPNDRQAIIAGGLAGAGKTTVLGDHAGIDQSKYLTINPDEIKVEMVKRGLVPKVDGLSPMEASDLVHEESSYVARRLALRAQADGKNVIWDITMSSRASTERRIDDLRDAGYSTMSGIFVDIPVEVSARRADGRHRQDQETYRAGDGLGGRYVPPEVITAQADPEWGSQNRRTFEELKPRFDLWARFDNGVDDRDPVLIEASSRSDDPEEPPL